VLMLIGTYVDTPFKSYGSGEWAITGQGHLGDLPWLIGFAIVGLAVVFGVVVSRGLRATPERAAWAALVVAAVGVASLVVAWAGLPVILATGAATLAIDSRDRLGHMPRPAAGALVLAPLIVVGAVAFAFAA